MFIELQDMKDFLGESGEDNDKIITDLIESAQEELESSTGILLATTKKPNLAKRAIRIMVWLSYFADRDETKNTQYLISERDRLMTKLEWGGADGSEET